MPNKPRILFLCTGNSCRSQMAEGWGKKLLAEKYEVYSAGIETHGLNPNAIKVMAENDIDISGHKSELLNEFTIDFDFIITVCDHARESCPNINRYNVLHIPFPDPPKLAKQCSSEEEALDCYRDVCLQIKELILKLDEHLVHI